MSLQKHLASGNVDKDIVDETNANLQHLHDEIKDLNELAHTTSTLANQADPGLKDVEVNSAVWTP